MNNKIGYRNESIYGEGFIKIREVLKHEIFSLGNLDLIYTMESMMRNDCYIFVKCLDTKYNEKDNEDHRKLCLEDFISLQARVIALSNSLDSIEDLYYKYYGKDNLEFNDIINYQIDVLCNHINFYFKKDIKYVLWLCDSVYDVIHNYSTKATDVLEIKIYDKSNVVLSTLPDGQGSLYGYEEVPKINEIEQNKYNQIASHKIIAS